MSYIISHAGMAELVDALDSKSSAARRAGSIPAPGTKNSTEQFKEVQSSPKSMSCGLFCVYSIPKPATVTRGEKI
jgi:hypothetical protein